ncbi:MAG: 50S ribosomal protein L28 [Alphaproteobacteria bacterium]|jgi:large subunit ribosomal protein L28|nr:50S ribosomal protein L28 [Alphaproteobacteria bacterium]MBP9877249.1 50S ribosomal protein L28 [Alphaproteobacteria bacterium]
MARRCDILDDKGVLVGNNVSHANNKTRRRFLPNCLNVTLMSDALKQTFRMKISRKAQRTIDFKGGFDAMLMKTKNAKLTPEALKIKRKVAKALEQSAASAA